MGIAAFNIIVWSIILGAAGAVCAPSAAYAPLLLTSIVMLAINVIDLAIRSQE